MHLDVKNLEGKMPTNMEGTRSATSNTAIKYETRGETEFDENEL